MEELGISPFARRVSGGHRDHDFAARTPTGDRGSLPDLLCVLITGVLLLGPSSASALFIDARIGGIFTDSSISTPVAGVVIDSEGNVYGHQVQSGEFVLVDVVVANPEGDLIEALFSTLIFQSDESSFFGGSFPPTILDESGVTASGLVNIDSGMIKASGDPGWLQALSYALLGGTTGAGPDTIRLLFQVTGATGDLVFEMGLTSGDSISQPSGAPVSVSFSGAFVTAVPEPGTALLLGIGLVVLSIVGGRSASRGDSRRILRTESPRHSMGSR